MLLDTIHRINYYVGSNIKNEQIKKIMRTINAYAYKLQYRFVKEHRYNVVYTDLPPHYYDIDVVMEAALVKLLRRYVDEELKNWLDFTDNDSSGYEKLKRVVVEDDKEFDPNNFYKEILTIYEWFVNEEPELRKQYNKLIKEWSNANPFKFSELDEQGLIEVVPTKNKIEAWEQAKAIEKNIDTTTDKYLVRLVELRKYLWT